MFAIRSVFTDLTIFDQAFFDYLRNNSLGGLELIQFGAVLHSQVQQFIYDHEQYGMHTMKCVLCLPGSAGELQRTARGLSVPAGQAL